VTQQAERLTSRQRRIEEQRRRIEQLHRDQRRKRLTLGVIVVAVVAVLLAGVVLLFPRPSAAQGRQVPLEQATHVDPGTPLTYRSQPPTSGMHYGAVPNPTDYRLYNQPISPGLWVHMLEHGSVVVLYRPDLCDSACFDVLADAYNNAPPDATFRLRKLAVTPYQDMDHAVAAVAWGWIDEMDQPDKDRILAFYRSHVDHGPESAP
jgi:hypothetical protein